MITELLFVNLIWICLKIAAALLCFFFLFFYSYASLNFASLFDRDFEDFGLRVWSLSITKSLGMILWDLSNKKERPYLKVLLLSPSSLCLLLSEAM